jgi:hypothetical protein
MIFYGAARARPRWENSSGRPRRRYLRPGILTIRAYRGGRDRGRSAMFSRSAWPDQAVTFQQ